MVVVIVVVGKGVEGWVISVGGREGSGRVCYKGEWLVGGTRARARVSVSDKG